MAQRQGEDDKTRFRSDRFFCEDGQWFFTTRENTVEGPFASRAAAERSLEIYLYDRRRRAEFGLPDEDGDGGS